ncbi:MAG: MEDS domain-containing protein [Ktedonobacterales bacterium]
MDLLIDGKRECIPSGSHILQLYNKQQEVTGIASQVFCDGLQRHEKCIAIAPLASADELEHALREKGLDTPALQGKGQLEYHTQYSAYLDGGGFNPYKMLARHQTAVAQSLREGWKAVRISIDMSWVTHGVARWQDIVKYEAACDAVFTFQNAPVIVLVTYDYSKIPGDLVVEMLRLHPVAVVGKFIKRNPYYLNSEQYLLKILRANQK